MKLKEVVCTCDACPSQWEGRTNDNRPVYIRYRFDYLSIGVGRPGETIEHAVRKSIYDPDFDQEMDWGVATEWGNVAPIIAALQPACAPHPGESGGEGSGGGEG